MLQRCVATNRCCPKLPEEELCAPHHSEGPPHVYGNPYLLEELSGHGQPEQDGFPPGFSSLMYEPPIPSDGSDQDDFAEEGEMDDIGGLEWMSGLGYVPREQVPMTSRPDPRPRPNAPLTRTASPGAALLAFAPRFPPEEEAPGEPGRSPFQGMPPTAGLRQRGFAGLATTASAIPNSAPGMIRSPSGGLPDRASALARSPSGPRASSAEPFDGPLAHSAAAQKRLARSATPSTPRRCAGDPGDVQPCLGADFFAPAGGGSGGAEKDAWQMSFHGRRLYGDENEFTGDAGAATIATLKRCMEKAQGLPVQQKPNSDKWTERWSSFQVDRKDVGVM